MVAGLEGLLKLGLFDTVDFGLEANQADVDGAEDRPIAAVEAADVDIVVVVDDGKGSVVEAGGSLGGFLAQNAEFLGHAGVDGLVVCAVELACGKERFQMGLIRARFCYGVDCGGEVGRVSDDFLEESLVGIEDGVIRVFTFKVCEVVPAQRAPLRCVEEAWITVLKSFHYQRVTASHKNGSVHTHAMSVSAAESYKVTSPTGVFDPGVAIGTVENFIE